MAGNRQPIKGRLIIQVDTQEYLDLVEKTNSILFWDIESSGGFNADYGSAVVISGKPFGKKAQSFVVSQVGHDQKIVREFREYADSFPVWCTYFGKGFDVKFVNSRLLKWKLPSLPKKLHIDMYFQLAPKLALSRKSMAHISSFLKTKHRKMAVDPDVWANAPFDPASLPILQQRCEADCVELEDLYSRTRQLIADIKR